MLQVSYSSSALCVTVTVLSSEVYMALRVNHFEVYYFPIVHNNLFLRIFELFLPWPLKCVFIGPHDDFEFFILGGFVLKWFYTRNLLLKIQRNWQYLYITIQPLLYGLDIYKCVLQLYTVNNYASKKRKKHIKTQNNSTKNSLNISFDWIHRIFSIIQFHYEICHSIVALSFCT